MTLGRTVRAIRFEKNLTQEELGSSVGVSRQTIMSIELDRTDPGFSLVQKISRVLGFSLDSIDPPPA